MRLRTLGGACEQPYAYRAAISCCDAEKKTPAEAGVIGADFEPEKLSYSSRVR